MMRVSFAPKVMLPVLIFLLIFSVASLGSVRALSDEMNTELKLTRVLYLGSSGSDVKALQEALRRIPDTYRESASGYFGRMTEAAVQRFQSREGLAMRGSPGYGQVGPKTVAKINEVIRRSSASSQTSVAPQSASMRGASMRSANSASATSSSTSTAALSAVYTSTSTSSSGMTITGTTSSTTTSASKASARPAADTTPPVRSFGSPENVLPMDTKKVTLSLVTSESARCYWSNTPNTAYEYMTTPFESTMDGTKHSYVFSLGQIPAGDYAFYVKCRDSNLNANLTDYPILFSVEHVEGIDNLPPRVIMSSPTNGDSVVASVITLSAAASDNTGVKGIRFYLNSQDLNFEDSNSPFSITVMLSAGKYRAFAVARDAAGNRATSTEISFTATPKSTTTSAISGTRYVSSPNSNLASASLPISELLDWIMGFFSRILR